MNLQKSLFKKLLFTAALSISIFYAGCSGNNQNENVPEKNSAGKDVLKFWHFWSEPSQRKAIQQLVKKFEEKYDCDVQLTELSWNDGKTKLLAAFNSRSEERRVGKKV